jgi:hypothetical protein
MPAVMARAMRPRLLSILRAYAIHLGAANIVLLIKAFQASEKTP